MTAALIGHNNPPPDVDILRDRLAEAHADLIARKNALMDSFGWAPEVIADAKAEADMSDFAKQLGDQAKKADSTRRLVKQPFEESAKAVDGFFKQITVPLLDAKEKVLARLTAYQRQKAERERLEREAAEKAQRAAAEKAAASIETAADLERAVAAEDAARNAADAAKASAADLSRVHGERGSTSSLRSVWTFEVTDELLVPRQYLMVNEQAIRSVVRMGERSIPGVRIYQEQKTVVR